MTKDEERARELLQSTRFIRGEIAIGIVLAYADEIRAEAAERVREVFDGTADITWENLRSAITGKEPTK
jgi:hypothetical protein